MKRIPTVVILSCLTFISNPASASFIYTGLTTDASGNVLGGAWTPTGASAGIIAPNLDPTAATVNKASEGLPNLFVSGTSGGVLTIDDYISNDSTTDRTFADSHAVHTFGFKGGTGDVHLQKRTSSFLPPVDGWNGFYMDTGAGVTEVTFRVRYDVGVTPRDDSNQNFGPYAFVRQLLNITEATYDTIDIKHQLIDTDLTPKSLADSPLYVLPQFVDVVPATSEDLANGISYLDGTTSSGIAVDQLSAADGALNTQYIGGVDITITRTDGQAFTEGTRFVFTLDGNNWEGAPDVVPEPSSFALLGIALTGTLLRRRRAIDSSQRG